MINLNLRPMLSALVRNRTGAILVALEIAIALAVMVNAAWIVAQDIQQIEQPSGFDEHDIFAVAAAALTSQSNLGSAQQEDLAYLRTLPGVVAATATSSVPLTPYGQGNSISRDPGPRAPAINVRTMQADEHVLQTLGVHVIAGRGFSAADIKPLTKSYSPTYPAILVTDALARQLFPHENALGKSVYGGDDTPMTIIGITSNFIPSVYPKPASYDAVLFPQTPGNYGDYVLLVRTVPGRTAELMRIAQRHLAASNPQRVIFAAHTLTYYRQLLDADNRDMVIFLTLVTALILSVTCLGIFGLTTFNVSARTKQIGTMRAVGARKRDIVTHFLVENAIVLVAGALVGCTLALAVGYWLSDQYQMPRLDLNYLGAGVLTLAVIGQLAAWQPARRAANVSPSVATRTV
jgi:putative ABC transport system permease protein